LKEHESKIQNAILLASRLERLSADSIWAHRASGVRGALLKAIEEVETPDSTQINASHIQLTRLESIVKWGYYLLEKAARELIE